MPNRKPADTQTEVLIPVLESQVIPCCERYGSERLAVTAETLKEFHAQQLPTLMRTTVKKRVGKKATTRSRRIFNNTSSFVASWPDDDQAIFRYPTLIFTLQGQADFHIGDYLVHCPQDHFLLFRNGIPRSIGEHPHLIGEDCEHRECSVLWFFAPPGNNCVSAYVCHSEGTKHWKGDFNYCAVHRLEVIHIYKLLVQELESHEAKDWHTTHLIFQAFLKLFLRELKEGRFHRAGQDNFSVEPDGVLSPITEAQKYIKTHLSEPLTAAKVAQEVYMSRNNFLRHFASETGQTFHEFLIQQRMEEAERLLSEGYWSVLRVCQFIGLRPSQFRAQFKKYSGITPSQFREDVLNKVRNR